MPNQVQNQSKTLNPQAKASLLSLLNLMISKAEKEDLRPVIRTSKLIELMKTSGIVMSYHQLSDLTNDPAIRQLIKDINKDEVTLRLPDDEDDDLLSDIPNNEEDTEGMEFPDDESAEGEMPPVQDQNQGAETLSVKHNGPNIVSAMAARALKRS